MKIIFVRHGESYDDIINCYGGAADWPLSDSGEKDAKELSELLNGTKLEKIYTSPMKRAAQTAEAIKVNQTCDIQTIFDLRERNSYGVISGCRHEDTKMLFGYMLDEFKEKPGDYYSKELILGAEPHLEFDQRVKSAIELAIKDAEVSGYETIAIVTHGNVTRSLYQNILAYGKRINLDHLARTEVDYKDDIFTIVSKSGIWDK